MGAIFAKLAKFGSKLRAFLPSEIPTEKAGFEAWVTSTLDLFGLEDTTVYRNAIYSLIMHMGNTQTHHSKRKFALALKRAKLQETTYAALETLRAKIKLEEASTKEKEAAALTLVSKPVDDTTTTQA